MRIEAEEGEIDLVVEPDKRQKRRKRDRGVLGKREQPRDPTNVDELKVAEVKTLIRNPDQFVWMFGVELKYHLPPRQFITWPYIFQVLSGEKTLLKASQIDLTAKVPKIEELAIKHVWPKVRQRTDLLAYMPLLGDDRMPPRTYLYQVLASVDKPLFNRIVNEAAMARRQTLKSDNQLVSVRKGLLDELKASSLLAKTFERPMSKRVSVKPVKRKKRAQRQDPI